MHSLDRMINRSIFILLLALCHPSVSACTFFKITKDGKTLVGNNEDAWSINARVRFENGAAGEFGAVYFAHYNGSPIREMMDQGGMNTEGLVFDALVVETSETTLKPGTRWIECSALCAQIMRTCATVYDAETIMRQYSIAVLSHAMLVFVDRNGDYLVVENDTLFTGNDTNYALGNFRMSRCVDIDAVPIERYQNGRALIANNAEASLEFGTAVLDKMAARRGTHDDRAGLTGTLYSNLYDPQNGIVHLYFYHDYNTLRSFNVKEELAKGDHELDMATLFPRNADYEKLVGYKTPMHSRVLFYFLLVMFGIAMLSALVSGFSILRNVVERMRGRAATGMVGWLLLLLSSIGMGLIIPFLIHSEGIYYFGLGYATDAIHPLLKYLPATLFAIALILIAQSLRGFHAMFGTRFGKWLACAHITCLLLFTSLLYYWGLVWV